jgi:hypothetical protein
MQRVLAFDIGIKNLAWCCIEVQSNSFTILGWDNYNLLDDSSNVGSKPASAKCYGCSAKALYTSPTLQSCARHCSSAYPPLRDASGTLLKKLPAVAGMKELLQSKVSGKIPSKKAELEAELVKYYSMPIQTKKVSRAPDAGLVAIHDSIQKLVLKQKALWSTCTLILLENQPVFKNPTMKSVQILLFATLRDLLQSPPPPLKLVHAGKKVKGAEKGDAGYKERKAGSEARVEQILYSACTPALQDAKPWREVWTRATKKSDLADAFSMCMDATGVAVRSESA